MDLYKSDQPERFHPHSWKSIPLKVWIRSLLKGEYIPSWITLALCFFHNVLTSSLPTAVSLTLDFCLPKLWANIVVLFIIISGILVTVTQTKTLLKQCFFWIDPQITFLSCIFSGPSFLYPTFSFFLQTEISQRFI